MRHLWENREDGVTCVVTVFLRSIFKLGCAPLFCSISMAGLECGFCCLLSLNSFCSCPTEGELGHNLDDSLSPERRCLAVMLAAQLLHLLVVPGSVFCAVGILPGEKKRTTRISEEAELPMKLLMLGGRQEALCCDLPYGSTEFNPQTLPALRAVICTACCTRGSSCPWGSPGALLKLLCGCSLAPAPWFHPLCSSLGAGLV